MKLGKYTVHPVAALFPAISDEELAELAQDIKTNGLQHPIVLAPDGVTLVDGINRWNACEKADVKPTFRTLNKSYDELKIILFIVSSNMRRRHLSAGQRAMIILEIEPMFAAAAKERMSEGGKKAGRGRPNKGPGNSSEAKRRKGEVREQMAKAGGIDATTVSRVKKIKADSPALAAQVAAGKISANDAYKQIRGRKSEASTEKRATNANKMLTLKTHDGQDVPYPLPKGKATFNRTNAQVSWAGWTWNPVTGCLHGCEYCYSREMAEVRESYRDAYPVGFTPLFHHERLDAPANTTVPDEAKTDSRLRRVFVCSMADLYGKWVPDEWIEKVHASAIANPQWDYLLLTKFPRRYVGLQLPPTAWVGTSVDEQKRVRLAEEAFRQIKDVRVKWLSLEPLLAPLEFTDLSMFDWIVIGSQSQTEQPDPTPDNPKKTKIVPAFAPPFKWVARLVAQARECGCRVYLKPNLLGVPNPQCPGMDLPQEEPDLPLMNGKDRQPQRELEL